MSDEESNRREVMLPERERVKKRKSRIFKNLPEDEVEDMKKDDHLSKNTKDRIYGKDSPIIRSEQEVLENLRRLLPSFSCEINCESEFLTQASSIDEFSGANQHGFAIEAFTSKDLTNPEIPQLIFSFTLSSLQDDEEIKKQDESHKSFAKITSFSDCVQTKIKISGSHEINRLSSLRKRYLIN